MTTDRCPRMLASGRVCGEPAIVLSEEGLICVGCFDTEIRRRDLVLRYRLRGGDRKISLDFRDIHVTLRGVRDGGFFKAQRTTDRGPGHHGLILVKGTRIETHFTDEHYPEGDPRRYTTGPGLDFVPLTDAEFAAAFAWTYEERIRRRVRELRTPDELYALGAQFLTYVPTAVQLTEGMRVGETRESGTWWAPVVVPLAWRVPPACIWAAWRIPLQPIGIMATVDEGQVWFVAWSDMMAVLRDLLGQFQIPHRPAIDIDALEGSA